MEVVNTLSKGERTRQFILEKVAPVFNKKGYSGTSMSDITKATGLTKGAIYGNFNSKEDLALEAFNFSFKRIISELNHLVSKENTPLDQLFAITSYYRNYYSFVFDFGGCPIVNISVDTHYQNPALFDRVGLVMSRMIDKMEHIIVEGIKVGQIKKDTDAAKYARIIFGQIEGGIFLAVMSKKSSYLIEIVDQVDKMINNELVT